MAYSPVHAVGTADSDGRQTMDTSQINSALGPMLTERASRHGNVYAQIRAGLLAEALGTLMAGSDRRTIRRTRIAVARRLAALERLT